LLEAQAELALHQQPCAAHLPQAAVQAGEKLLQ
jgi:hypothetical protein